MNLHRLPDGRELAWTQYGDADGAPWFYLNGAGSSRLEPAYAHGLARRLRLRIIGVDRPGYGHSTRSDAPGFPAFARDLLHLADALGLQRFGVAGMSAGAPHALHVAAQEPQRVRAVALINGSSESTHPAWRATPLWLRLASRIAMGALLGRMAARLKADPAGFCARASRSEGWHAGELAGFVAAVSEGMRQDGAVETMKDEGRRVLAQSWGLDWSALACPVLAFCGERDPGRWFYHELSRRAGGLQFIGLPGGHQPIVGEAAWARIARATA